MWGSSPGYRVQVGVGALVSAKVDLKFRSDDDDTDSHSDEGIKTPSPRPRTPFEMAFAPR